MTVERSETNEKPPFKTPSQDEKDRKIPTSVIFWNGLILIPLMILALVDLRLLYLAWAVGSLFAIGILFDKTKTRHLWIVFMPATWIFVLWLAFGLIFRKIRRIILKINETLDQR